MITYLDSSVILRIVLGQPKVLKDWRTISRAVASALVEVECLRTLDRLRLQERISDEELSIRRESVYRFLESIELVEISRAILLRAGNPLGTPLGTLDAIHLVTALQWKEQVGLDLVLATHDDALALAARSHGLKTVGAA
ncbi:MAG: type II toxin-antitoxin system VapC family toxin [Nitrospiraceae bacterium]